MVLNYVYDVLKHNAKKFTQIHRCVINQTHYWDGKPGPPHKDHHNINHKNIDKLNEENFKLNLDITKKGINFFERRFDDPKFFIWSNDFSGLKENFPSDKYVFVNNKTHTDDVYDLYLMTLCKNFIISPSTFSYWGAFLSNNKNKICLGPPNIKNKSGYYGFSNNKDIKPDWWF